MEEGKVKIPKWLRVKEGVTVAVRPDLEIDLVEGDGTAKDSVRYRPPHKYRVSKKVDKRLKQMEELRKWGEDKGKLNLENIQEHMGRPKETQVSPILSKIIQKDISLFKNYVYLQVKKLGMKEAILWYLLIGVSLTALVDWVLREDSENLTLAEAATLIWLWPIGVVVFIVLVIYHIATDDYDRNNDNEGGPTNAFGY